jgi:aspartate 1-decarboxylase
VIEGREGSGEIVINGAAAHLIGAGQMVTIMAFAQTETPITPKRLLLDGKNRIVSESVK